MNISVFIWHFNIWDTDVNYDGYKSDSIIIEEHITYEKLISTIVAELESKKQEKKIKVRYVVDVVSVE